MNRSTNLTERVRFGTFELNVDGIVRPKNLPYFLPRNNVALALDEDSQNLKGLLAEQDLCGPAFHIRGSD